MDILVYLEKRGNNLRTAGFEAVTAARKLADVSGGKLIALLAGSNLEGFTADAEKYGADQILLAEDQALEGYTPDGHRAAIVAAMEKTSAKLVLMAATALGRDLAPTVAANLNAALLPDCISIEVIEGRLTVTRPVYAGRAIMTLATNSWPAVVSLRPKAFTAVVRDGGKAEIAKLDVQTDIKTKLIETRFEAGGKLDVTEADIIVAGGRGMKSNENFKLIEDISSLLNGAVGASRPVVDSEWRPHSEQIGQTGKVVGPTLYFAVGISGAIQHLAGMRSSKVVVAINKDPDAPIFKSADYGIVGDAMEVLPALIEALK
ncbi:electron transfer flavoprotein subunit alpha/FixB family protein [bacterium]|nr:electron transfer flavoprotein subunit alpha/FixB family protein [bacterium]